MKKLMTIIIATLFIAGCSNAVDKDDLMSNVWIGDIGELSGVINGDILPLRVELNFYENSFDYDLNFDDLYEILVANPENDIFTDDPMIKIMTKTMTSPYTESSLEYTLEDSIFTFDPDFGNDGLIEIKLEKTQDGFKASTPSPIGLEILEANFKRK